MMSQGGGRFLVITRYGGDMILDRFVVSLDVLLAKKRSLVEDFQFKSGETGQKKICETTWHVANMLEHVNSSLELRGLLP